jgi:hypothetical protein
MPYRVTRGADERPSIVLEHEPAYCQPLAAAPPAREPELGQGLWLVMAFATWSMPDVDAIRTALATAKHFGGALKLGLRPFDSPDEHQAWCRGLASSGNSPFWVLLRDGEIRMQRAGLITMDALVAAIEPVRRR